MVSRQCAALVLIGLLLSAPLAAQRRVWVVDQADGIGVDFTDIPPAIAAASPGDRIEVRGPGSYSRFLLDKGLDLEALVPGVFVGDPPEVVGIPLRLSARLSALRGTTLRLRACPGPVQLSDLWFGSSDTSLGILDCASVLLLRSTLSGGPAWLPGIAAVTVTRSRVAIQGCNVIGGQGQHAHPLSGPARGGGIPLWATDSNLLVAGTTCTGGNGGAGYGWGTCLMSPSGGGTAFAATNSEALLMQRFILRGGPRGPALPPCPPGRDGLAVSASSIDTRVTDDCTLTGGTFGATILRSLPSVATPGVAARGQPVTLAFAGAPGTWLMTWFDAMHGYLGIPGVDGPFLLTAQAVSIPILAIGADGTLPLRIVVPGDPSLRDQMVFCQAVAVAPGLAVSLTNLGDLCIR